MPVAQAYVARKHPREQTDDAGAGGASNRRQAGAVTVDGVAGLIGGTPLVRIRSLSELTGCEILGKAEFLNPGGSVKDRVALQIVEEAFEAGRLARGGLVTEGTAGSTGISLAMVRQTDREGTG